MTARQSKTATMVSIRFCKAANRRRVEIHGVRRESLAAERTEGCEYVPGSSGHRP